jgi:hypothetical protein
MAGLSLHRLFEVFHFLISLYRILLHCNGRRWQCRQIPKCSTGNVKVIHCSRKHPEQNKIRFQNVSFQTVTSRTQIATILTPQNFITWLESQFHLVCSCQLETNYTCDRTIKWRVIGKRGLICTVTSLEEVGGIKWILMNTRMMGRVSRSLWQIREFYIRGSVHRNSKLIKSNKMQQYAGIYLPQNHSTFSWCPSLPS